MSWLAPPSRAAVVDGRFAPLAAATHVVGVGDVALDQLDADGSECRRLVGVADERPDIVAALDELLADVGAGEAGSAGDEDGIDWESPVREDWRHGHASG